MTGKEKEEIVMELKKEVDRSFRILEDIDTTDLSSISASLSDDFDDAYTAMDHLSGEINTVIKRGFEDDDDEDGEDGDGDDDGIEKDEDEDKEDDEQVM